MPWGPHWRAADLANARTPSTAVVAGTNPPAPVNPALGAISTMRPVTARCEPCVGSLECHDRVAHECLRACVPLAGCRVDQGLRDQSGVVDAHVHDRVEGGGASEHAVGRRAIGTRVGDLGDRRAQVDQCGGEVVPESRCRVGHQYRAAVQHVGIVRQHRGGLTCYNRATRVPDPREDPCRP